MRSFDRAYHKTGDLLDLAMQDVWYIYIIGVTKREASRGTRGAGGGGVYDISCPSFVKLQSSLINLYLYPYVLYSILHSLLYIMYIMHSFIVFVLLAETSQSRRSRCSSTSQVCFLLCRRRCSAVC